MILFLLGVSLTLNIIFVFGVFVYIKIKFGINKTIDSLNIKDLDKGFWNISDLK